MTISSSPKRSDLKRVDRISGLPDHLLCCILAFLPTTSAMATSVLSRRWEYVWTGVPVLNFTRDPRVIRYNYLSIAAAQDYQSLKYYMNRVLLHNNAVCLERVDFEIFPLMTEKNCQEWFQVLSRRSVKEVNLFFKDCCSVPIMFLLDGILGNHLVALRLDCEPDFPLTVPFTSTVHLPWLEKVHLSSVVISNDSKPLISLIRCCPRLRELSIRECQGFINFSCSTLRILKMSAIELFTGSIGVPNLEYFELNNVDEFHYDDDDCRFLTGDMPYLAEAKVECHLNVAMWSDLFQTIRHVINLDISIYPCIHCALQENTTVHLKLPYFDRLKCLELHCSDEHSIRQTSLFLRHIPNCVSLIIHMGPAPYNSFAELKGWPEVDSLGLEFHVEYIEIDGFDPDRLVIIEVLKYLLVYCTRLKELKLHMRKRWVAEQKNAMQKTIMELSRPSGCKIVIDERMW